jgi:mono/diheme cytochrome c family protein
MRNRHVLSIAAVFVFALTGCKSTPPSKPLEQLTQQERAGHAAFITNCSTCHYDRETGSLHGPSLLGVYRKQYLPSGAPANDDRIANTIQHGRGNMPALGAQVGSDDIADILAYLKTL